METTNNATTEYNQDGLSEEAPLFLLSNDSFYLYHSRAKPPPSSSSTENQRNSRKQIEHNDGFGFDIFNEYSLLDSIENRYGSSRVLGSREKKYIRNTLQKNPSLFNTLQEEITYVQEEEGRIELHDFPEVILFIYNLYQKDIIENTIENLCIINLIDFTMDILVEKKMIYLPNTEKMVIRKMIKTSLNLLETNTKKLVKEEEECCINTLYHIFEWIFPPPIHKATY